MDILMAQFNVTKKKKKIKEVDDVNGVVGRN